MISRRVFVGTMLAGIAARARPPVRVSCVLVGDSHAFMMGPHFRRRARENGVAVDVVPKPGSSWRQWIRKGWMRLVRRRYPDATTILISLGTNATRVERPHIRNDIVTLCAMADEGSELGRAVIALPPPLGFSTDYLKNAVRGLAVHCIDPGELPMQSDKVHATFDGYATWSERVARDLWSWR